MIGKKTKVLGWEDVDKLIDHLLPQFNENFNVLLMVGRGGIIPGGIISQALDIRRVFIASVRFAMDLEQQARLFAWPDFVQFPTNEQIYDQRVLIVDDVWSGGRTINTVRARVEDAGGHPKLAVLHYKPTMSLLPHIRPDYYAAITDAFIVYPWEIDHDIKRLRLFAEG